MAQHRAVRGESTYHLQGGKVSEKYEGKHRKDDGVKGYRLGSDKRRVNPGQDYERDK